MNKLEVMKILGKVARSTFFELKGEEVWEWRFKDGQLSRLFTVSFDRQGSVLATATIDDPKEALAGGK
jgi:hypothetical protein